MRGLLKKLNSDRGAVAIVEASIVFPITFIIVFMLLYLGNGYYMKAQLEKIVVEQAILGASYCADPVLMEIKENDAVPDVGDLQIKPYRYIAGNFKGLDKYFGNTNATEKMIEKNVVEMVEKTASFFPGMQAKLKNKMADGSDESKIAMFNNYIIYSTFSVEVACEVAVPVRIFGTEPIIMTLKARSEVPVGDTPEFIRNIDMVWDLMEGTPLGNGISKAFDTINDLIGRFAEAGS